MILSVIVLLVAGLLLAVLLTRSKGFRGERSDPASPGTADAAGRGSPREVGFEPASLFGSGPWPMETPLDRRDRSEEEDQVIQPRRRRRRAGQDRSSSQLSKEVSASAPASPEEQSDVWAVRKQRGRFGRRRDQDDPFSPIFRRRTEEPKLVVRLERPQPVEEAPAETRDSHRSRRPHHEPEPSRFSASAEPTKPERALEAAPERPARKASPGSSSPAVLAASVPARAPVEPSATGTTEGPATAAHPTITETRGRRSRSGRSGGRGAKAARVAAATAAPRVIHLVDSEDEADQTPARPVQASGPQTPTELAARTAGDTAAVETLTTEAPEASEVGKPSGIPEARKTARAEERGPKAREAGSPAADAEAPEVPAPDAGATKTEMTAPVPVAAQESQVAVQEDQEESGPLADALGRASAGGTERTKAARSPAALSPPGALPDPLPFIRGIGRTRAREAPPAPPPRLGAPPPVVHIQTIYLDEHGEPVIVTEEEAEEARRRKAARREAKRRRAEMAEREAAERETTLREATEIDLTIEGLADAGPSAPPAAPATGGVAEATGVPDDAGDTSLTGAQTVEAAVPEIPAAGEPSPLPEGDSPAEPTSATEPEPETAVQEELPWWEVEPPADAPWVDAILGVSTSAHAAAAEEPTAPWPATGTTSAPTAEETAEKAAEAPGAAPPAAPATTGHMTRPESPLRPERPEGIDSPESPSSPEHRSIPEQPAHADRPAAESPASPAPAARRVSRPAPIGPRPDRKPPAGPDSERPPGRRPAAGPRREAASGTPGPSGTSSSQTSQMPPGSPAGGIPLSTGSAVRPHVTVNLTEQDIQDSDELYEVKALLHAITRDPSRNRRKRGAAQPAEADRQPEEPTRPDRQAGQAGTSQPVSQPGASIPLGSTALPRRPNPWAATARSEGRVEDPARRSPQGRSDQDRKDHDRSDAYAAFRPAPRPPAESRPAVPRPAPQAESRPAPRPEARPAQRPEARPAQRPEARPFQRSEPPRPRQAEARSAQQVQARSAQRPVPQQPGPQRPVPQPEPRSASQPAPRAGSRPEQRPEPRPAVRPAAPVPAPARAAASTTAAARPAPAATTRPPQARDQAPRPPRPVAETRGTEPAAPAKPPVRRKAAPKPVTLILVDEEGRPQLD